MIGGLVSAWSMCLIVQDFCLRLFLGRMTGGKLVVKFEFQIVGFLGCLDALGLTVVITWGREFLPFRIGGLTSLAAVEYYQICNQHLHSETVLESSSRFDFLIPSSRYLIILSILIL